jgi:hypothetical protein
VDSSSGLLTDLVELTEQPLDLHTAATAGIRAISTELSVAKNGFRCDANREPTHITLHAPAAQEVIRLAAFCAFACANWQYKN